MLNPEPEWNKCWREALSTILASYHRECWLYICDAEHWSRIHDRGMLYRPERPAVEPPQPLPAAAEPFILSLLLLLPPSWLLQPDCRVTLLMRVFRMLRGNRSPVEALLGRRPGRLPAVRSLMRSLLLPTTCPPGFPSGPLDAPLR